MEQKEERIRAYSKSSEEVIKILETSRKGLTSKQAESRLEKYGKNELKKLKKLNAIKIFLRQFNSFLIYITLVAALISLIIRHMLDFYVIIAIVIINVCLGFFQEYKAERAIEELRKYMVKEVEVMRDEKIQIINSESVVPGDILILKEGDRVMADARVLESEGLQVNEMPLTGESVASGKHSEKLELKTVLADRENMVYFGTEVVRGKAKAVVVGTGMDTEFGKISRLVQEIKEEKTPLQKKLDNFARNLGLAVIGISILMFFIGISMGNSVYIMFLTAVSLTVSVIPQGLPAVITLTLAITLRRMAKSNALIRKLPAAETLGRVSVIATDKTGRITTGEMTVKKIYADREIDLEKIKNIRKSKQAYLLFKTGILCNNSRVEYSEDKKDFRVIGDPTENALVYAALNFGLNKEELEEKEEKLKEFEFSSERKMMSVVRTNGTETTSYVKGSPEEIIMKCSKFLVKGKIMDLGDKQRREIERAYESLASRGLRVLGFAYKPIAGYKKEIKQEQAENNLVFIGFQGMMDPPRKGVKRALKQAGKAGIRVMMVTGDSDLTARAIANIIGLKGELVKAEELENMSDAELSQRIDRIAIFSRASPEDKLRIVNILKEKKEIVGVTGDGVNDSLALKRSDIGIAMGIKGTDVSKDVSDIILLDDNFASIVSAIKEGRRAYSNIKKFVKFLLCANFGELFLILFSLLLGMPLPLLPLQILWLNLVSDSFPALALGVEPVEKDIMKRKPTRKGIFHGLWGHIVTAGFIAAILTMIVFSIYMENLERARTIALSTIIFFELFLVFPFRSNDKLREIGFFSNSKLLYGVGFSFLLLLVVIYTPLNTAFSLVPLGIFDWGIVLLFSFPALVIFESVKYFRRNKNASD
jgi:Ca2+-transporting ATPase